MKKTVKMVFGLAIASLMMFGCNNLNASLNEGMTFGEGARAVTSTTSTPNHYVKLTAASGSTWSQTTKFQFKITGLTIKANDAISFLIQAPSGATSLTVRGATTDVKWINGLAVTGGNWYKVSCTATAADTELGITFYTSSTKTTGSIKLGDLKIGANYVSAESVKNNTKSYYSSPETLNFDGSFTTDGSSDSGNTPAEPEKPVTPPATGSTIKLSSSALLKKYSLSGVSELSSLCLSKNKDYLWGFGDSGDFFKITFDGKVTKMWSYDEDTEGVAIDPSTGTLYVSTEPNGVYTITNTSSSSSMKRIFKVSEAANMGNSGLEGIEYYNGYIYVGSQDGATLWKYSVDGTKKSKIRLDSLSNYKLGEVADLCYDNTTDELWVIDSDEHIICVFDGAVTKLLRTYDFSSITTGNTESVCIDHNNHCIWLADDSDTSKLYKVAVNGI